MDRDNLESMRALAPDAAAEAKLGLLLDYDPIALVTGDREVPDPYFGGDDGFEEVLDMVERACDGLIEEIRTMQKL